MRHQDGTELFPAEEMQSPFDVIKETDAEGREWWNSRKLARPLSLLAGDDCETFNECG